MKKLFLVAAMLTAFVANSFAAPAKPFTSGIMLTEGLEIARGDGAPDFTDFNGFRYFTNLSYNALIGITPELFIHPSIGLVIRSASEAETETTSNGVSFNSSTTAKQSNIAMGLGIPVTARYYITNMFFAELGLEFDINFFESYYSKEADEWNKVDDAKTLNFGINAGLGLTFAFGLEIGLTYTHGITDLYEQHTFGVGPLSIKTNTWSYSRINFNIGYWFGYR